MRLCLANACFFSKDDMCKILHSRKRIFTKNAISATEITDRNMGIAVVELWGKCVNAQKHARLLDTDPTKQSSLHPPRTICGKMVRYP